MRKNPITVIRDTTTINLAVLGGVSHIQCEGERNTLGEALRLKRVGDPLMSFDSVVNFKSFSQQHLHWLIAPRSRSAGIMLAKIAQRAKNVQIRFQPLLVMLFS